jgi:hypothetical protein
LNDESLPDWMSTLNTFSEKERQHYQYQARQEFQREQRITQLKQDQVRQEASAGYPLKPVQTPSFPRRRESRLKA